jgi:hypothetical protein
VFAIDDGDLAPVQIQSPEAWYKSRLEPGESTWNSNGNSFYDNKLSFGFAIWAGEDPHASLTAGGVTGTYKIIKETKAQPVGAALAAPFGPAYTSNAAMSAGSGHPLITWEMVVDTASREPVVRR